MIDIIELAKKAGITKCYVGLSGVSIDASSIERFAALYKQALIDSGELVPAEKVKADAVDAERYRWLCDKLGQTHLPALIERIINDYVADYKPSIDATIDRARSAK